MQKLTPSNLLSVLWHEHFTDTIVKVDIRVIILQASYTVNNTSVREITRRRDLLEKGHYEVFAHFSVFLSIWFGLTQTFIFPYTIIYILEI